MAPSYVGCRICRSVEGKLKNYEDDDFLIEAYEELTGITYTEIMGLSKFCPKCACLIRKTYRFRRKCINSYEYIMDHLGTGRKVTKRFLEMSHFQICKLSTWQTKHYVFDYTHKHKAYKNKRNLIEGQFNIQHLTVPKESEPTESQLDSSESDMDESLMPSTPHTPTLEPELLNELTVAKDPSHMETLVMESSVLCGTEEVLELEVKMEETELLNVDEKLEVKQEIDLEPDPDNLTLQEIKAELLSANETEDIAIFNQGEKRKAKKGMVLPERGANMSDKSGRLQVQARRLKSNQELEEHFVITQFLTEDEQVQEFLKRREGEGYLEGKYKCELCLKSFKEQKWMDAHVKKHEPESGSYVCSICKIRCRTPKLHRTHRDCNHTVRFSCRRCNFLTYSKAQALKHHGWHEGVEHTCQHCGATFRKHTTYMGHLRRAHPSAHICGACARSFVSAYGLNLHVKAVHKEITKMENDSTRCEDCDVTFVSRRVYTRHVLTTDKHKDISKDILGCSKCGDQFLTREEMEAHSHYKERKYVRKDAPRRTIKCDECSEVFTHPNGVYQHYLREHPDTPYRFAGRRHYLCEQCGRTFKSPGLLQQHSLTHLGMRPPPAKKPAGRNSCRLCGKTYSKLSGLFRHKLCSEVFTHPNGVYQHYLREHPDTPYRFAGRRHYLCEQCGRTFKSPGLLQQHSLTHLGMRPPPAKKPAGRNSCRLCGKTYSKLSGLFRHKLTHLGVRRHKCHICEKAFTDTSNLKQHVRGVHLNMRRVRKR